MKATFAPRPGRSQPGTDRMAMDSSLRQLVLLSNNRQLIFEAKLSDPGAEGTSQI